MFFRVLITILFLIVLGTLIRTILLAFRARGDSAVTRNHKWWGWVTLVFTIIAIGCVEAMVRLEHDTTRPALFKIHLPCGIIFVITLITQLVWTGEKRPTTHRILGYICVGAYLCTFVTGLVLLWYY